MKYTKEEFITIISEVIDYFCSPTDDGDKLPAPCVMLLVAVAAKLTNKLFDNDEEIELFKEDLKNDNSNK